MKIIHKKRGAGKTTELIKMSHNKRRYIVCRDRNAVQAIFKRAHEMEMNILFPMTYGEFLKGDYGHMIDGFLIDDADYFLQMLSRHVRIDAITLTKEENKRRQS